LTQFLLFGDFTADIIETASEALLPLILSERKNYSEMVQQIVNQQADSALKQRLGNAFNELTTKGNVSLSLDRKSISQFKKNLEEFLSNVKSFLLTK